MRSPVPALSRFSLYGQRHLVLASIVLPHSDPQNKHKVQSQLNRDDGHSANPKPRLILSPALTVAGGRISRGFLTEIPPNNDPTAGQRQGLRFHVRPTLKAKV